jgi:hypothetical protein
MCFKVSNRLLPLVCLWIAGAGAACADSVVLNPAQDTFISEAIATPGGTAPDLIIGTQGILSGQAKNRGLIQFDLSSIPPGAVVNAVTLRLTVTRVPFTPVNSNFHLHRVLQPWDGSQSTWSLRLDPADKRGLTTQRLRAAACRWLSSATTRSRPRRNSSPM